MRLRLWQREPRDPAELRARRGTHLMPGVRPPDGFAPASAALAATPSPHPHLIRVIAHWHQDQTAGLEMTCSCGSAVVQLCTCQDYDISEAALADLNAAAQAHLATHARSGAS